MLPQVYICASHSGCSRDEDVVQYSVLFVLEPRYFFVLHSKYVGAN